MLTLRCISAHRIDEQAMQTVEQKSGRDGRVIPIEHARRDPVGENALKYRPSTGEGVVFAETGFMEQEMMQRLIDDGEFEETINKPVEPSLGGCPYRAMGLDLPDNGVRSSWRTRP